MHSGGRIPPASLKQRVGEHGARVRQPLRGENPPGLIEAGPVEVEARGVCHSGGRIPPASLKPEVERPGNRLCGALRGENPPGLIEAIAPPRS